jgi:hypothetical protein
MTVNTYYGSTQTTDDPFYASVFGSYPKQQGGKWHANGGDKSGGGAGIGAAT